MGKNVEKETVASEQPIPISQTVRDPNSGELVKAENEFKKIISKGE